MYNTVEWADAWLWNNNYRIHENSQETVMYMENHNDMGRIVV